MSRIGRVRPARCPGCEDQRVGRHVALDIATLPAHGERQDRDPPENRHDEQSPFRLAPQQADERGQEYHVEESHLAEASRIKSPTVTGL